MKFLLATISIFLILSACSSNDPITGEESGNKEPVKVAVIELSPEASQAAASVERFNIDFFCKVALSDKYKGKNVVCSPLSASMLLSLLSNAASDKTAAEIVSVLGFSDTDALNNLYTELSSKLPALDPKATLAFANSLWYDKQYTLTDAFSAVANNCYKADVFKRDLSGATPGVNNEINSWVNEKTRGLIKKISINMPALSTLVNAAYFNATWKDPFMEELTRKDTFKGIDGNVQVDMMSQANIYPYVETDEYKIVEMPFGTGSFVTTIILPSDDAEEFLDSDALKSALSKNLEDRHISLFLPRFKMEPDKEMDVTEVLCDMGVKSLSGSGSVRMFNENTEVKEIKIYQKNSVEFNEKGAEAAGATYSYLCSSNGTSIPLMKMDRPFIFLITEKSTKTILFAGKIMSL